MAKMDKEDVASGQIDARKVKLVDITEFAEENGIDFLPDPDKGVRENLNGLRDALVAVESEPAKPEEDAPEPETEEEPQIVDEEPEEDLPPYLARRAHLIKAAKEQAKEEGIAAVTYGPDAPAYLRRRGKQA